LAAQLTRNISQVIYVNYKELSITDNSRLSLSPPELGQKIDIDNHKQPIGLDP
jgi:hypothetical protein